IEKRDRERRPGAPPSVPLPQFAGEYEHPAYGVGRIEAANGRLTWEWGRFTCPLEHYQGDTFRVTDGYFADQLVEFAGSNGRVTALRTMGVVFSRKEGGESGR